MASLKDGTTCSYNVLSVVSMFVCQKTKQKCQTSQSYVHVLCYVLRPLCIFFFFCFFVFQLMWQIIMARYLTEVLLLYMFIIVITCIPNRFCYLYQNLSMCTTLTWGSILIFLSCCYQHGRLSCLARDQYGHDCVEYMCVNVCASTHHNAYFPILVQH